MRPRDGRRDALSIPLRDVRLARGCYPGHRRVLPQRAVDDERAPGLPQRRRRGGGPAGSGAPGRERQLPGQINRQGTVRRHGQQVSLDRQPRGRGPVVLWAQPDARGADSGGYRRLGEDSDGGDRVPEESGPTIVRHGGRDRVRVDRRPVRRELRQDPEGVGQVAGCRGVPDSAGAVPGW